MSNDTPLADAPEIETVETQVNTNDTPETETSEPSTDENQEGEISEPSKAVEAKPEQKQELTEAEKIKYGMQKRIDRQTAKNAQMEREIAELRSLVEKSQPASIPAAARQKVLSLLKENITPDILARMISAGLKRNFTVDEIEVLSKYDESQLSDELRKKNEFFKFEVSRVIGLLLAASSG